MGGRVGLILALTEPQLIDKLVCVDTTPINTQISLDRWQTLRDACRLLKDMELQLRQTEGIARSMMADKVRLHSVTCIRSSVGTSITKLRLCNENYFLT